MKILIVDDSINKIKDIYNVLLSVDGITESDIEHCNDVMNARAKLRSQKVDLLILDLNMPEEITMNSSEQSGFSFINEIIKTNRYNIPNDICILTEYLELKDEFDKKGFDYYFPIITYNKTSQEWENRLKARVNYLLKYHLRFYKDKKSFDVALITAVPVETKAVKKAFGVWEKFNMPNDPTLYYKTFIDNGKCKISVVLAEQASMGMIAASALSTKMLLYFNPKYLIMPGIAAGIDKYNFGDIIFPKYVYNYSSGKYVSNDKEKSELLNIMSPLSRHK